MALKRPNTLAALDAAVGVHAPRDSELPQLNSLVQTTADQVATIGRKGNRVHAVLVAVGVLQSLNQITGGGVPHTNALVERTSSHIVTIRRHSHSGDSVLNAKGVNQLAVKNIPQTHGLVTTARGDVAAISGEIQRIDVLFVATKDVLDGSRGNVPHLIAPG